MTTVEQEPTRRAPAVAPSAGRVGRRRPAPSGRAVAGGFLVTAAVVGVVAIVLSSGHRSGTDYVVAAHDLPPGAVLHLGDLTTERLDLPASGLAGLAWHDPSALVGHVLAAPLRGGELLQQGDVAASSTDGLRPVVVAVAATDASVLTVGGPADVLVTSGEAASATTTVVVTGARVLAVERSATTLVSGGATASVTLGVASLADVTAVVHAAHSGTVSLVVGASGDERQPRP